MNVLTHQSRAARAASVPTGLLVWARRMRDRLGIDRWGLRFAAGLGAGLLGGLLGRWGSTALSSCAGLLFGWAGVAGAALGQLAMALALGGEPLRAVAVAFAAAALGASSFRIFQVVPELGRGLPNLPSYLWLLGSGVLGGLIGGLGLALVTRLAGSPVPSLHGFWVWTANSLLGVLLVAPPVTLVADRYFRRWLAPIARELPARRSRRLSLAPPQVESLGDETVRIAPARPRLDLVHTLLAGMGMVLGLTAVAVAISSFVPEGGPWVLLVYLIPILWAAMGYGLRGGVLMASASGLAYLLGLAWVRALTGDVVGVDPWVQSAHLLILAVAGAFIGESREHEARLRDELLDANRLLRRDLLNVAQALTQAVEAKDSYTEGHLHRVSDHAVAVGARLGLRGQDLEMLHYASMLHDIGKIGIPEDVLRKEGPLDPVQAEIMRRHPEIGARILEKLDLLKGAAPIVLCHQERYDGVRHGEYPGYPRGLRGEEIPLGARIVAVVDAFDAMTTDRPYRAALPLEAAITALRRERGRQFDPKVVDAFLQLLLEKPWRGRQS
jgi:MFS family permease